MTTTEGKTIEQMTAEVRENNIRHGWRDQKTSFGDQIALLHSELSEALEAYRHGKLRWDESADKHDDVESEIADVFIRTLDFCDLWGIDLERAYERKMAVNRSRPWRHGGKAM